MAVEANHTYSNHGADLLIDLATFWAACLVPCFFLENRVRKSIDISGIVAKVHKLLLST
jgi:hypothetical protein